MIAELQLFKGQHMKILYLNDWLMERRPLLVDETVCCTRWRTGECVWPLSVGTGSRLTEGGGFMRVV